MASRRETRGSRPGNRAKGERHRPWPRDVCLAATRAVRKVGSTVYCYDQNGNMNKRAGSTISYTSYNLPSVINSGSNSSTISYGAFRNRYKQVAVASGATETTIYVAGLLEKVTRGSLVEWRHFIQGGKGTAAIYTRRSGSSTVTDTVYVHRDHLGSPELITNASGTVVVRLSFGAYGERRDGSDWDGPPSAGDWTKIGNTTRHGFTGHEHLDAVGLIHMNGRAYDPVAGRFLGIDPIVQMGNSQSPNGFSYVWNNPLTMIDPSGFDPCDVVVTCGNGNGGEPPGRWPDPFEPPERQFPREHAYLGNWDNPLLPGDFMAATGQPMPTFDMRSVRVVTIYLRTFAPWAVFGGGFAGDNRTFSTDLEDTARMTAEVVIDLLTMDEIGFSRWSDPSRYIENPCLDLPRLSGRIVVTV